MNNPQAVRSKLTIATVCSDVAQGKSGGLIFGCVVFHVVQWQDGSLLVFAGSIPVRADAGSIPDVEILFPFSFYGGGRVKPVVAEKSSDVGLFLQLFSAKNFWRHHSLFFPSPSGHQISGLGL